MGNPDFIPALKPCKGIRVPDISEKKGRPMKVHESPKPIMVIIECVENEKRNNANNQFSICRKLREHLH